VRTGNSIPDWALSATGGAKRGPSSRTIPTLLLVAAVLLTLASLFVPLWQFTAKLNNGTGGTASIDFSIFLDGHYFVVASTGQNSTSCPIAGGNATRCDSLNATARLYGAVEGSTLAGAGVCVLGFLLGMLRPRGSRKRNWAWIVVIVGAIMLLAGAASVAALQPSVFSADTPSGEGVHGSPFGELPGWCSHSPDNSFWAGCTSTGPTDFIKWAPGIGWFFLLLGGVLAVLGGLFLRTVVARGQVGGSEAPGSP
jgi:hypothetical protein